MSTTCMSHWFEKYQAAEETIWKLRNDAKLMASEIAALRADTKAAEVAYETERNDNAIWIEKLADSQAELGEYKEELRVAQGALEDVTEDYERLREQHYMEAKGYR